MTDDENQEMAELDKKIRQALDDFNLAYAQRLLNRYHELEAKQKQEKPE